MAIKSFITLGPQASTYEVAQRGQDLLQVPMSYILVSNLECVLNK